MNSLTSAGQQAVKEIADKYELQETAVQSMLQAVINGGGTMAQFNVPSLGGSGQWMQGGMTMVGDMFNNSLKVTVNNLCNELSELMRSRDLFIPTDTTSGRSNSNTWYPSGLGNPTASGAQNDTRYAYFQSARRLVLDYKGAVSVYDTLDHVISGIAQQQGAKNSVQFTSQYGIVNTLNLPLISGPGTLPKSTDFVATSSTVAIDQDDATANIFETIEKLGNLYHKGLLTEEEFQTKKAELLARL